MPFCVLKHYDFWLSKGFYPQILVIDALKDSLQTFCERLHQQSRQVVLMCCMGKIVEGSHHRNVMFDIMEGFVLADGAILCAEDVNGHLKTFLPLSRYCKNEDATNLKRMFVKGFYLKSLLDWWCIFFGNLRVQVLGKRNRLWKKADVLINSDVFVNEGKWHDLC